MAGKTLSDVSSEATQQTNTTGVLTSILEIQPSEGLVLVFRNMVESGQEPGIPIAASLQDSNGNDLPLTTNFALAYERPSDDDFQVVSELRDDIEPYRILTLTEQRKEDYIDSTKVKLRDGSPRLVVRDVDKLYVVVNSSSQIDWANSRLAFNENAVREISEDRWRNGGA